jgi:vacuolar-type H+-ATPase subunit H
VRRVTGVRESEGEHVRSVLERARGERGELVSKRERATERERNNIVGSSTNRRSEMIL